MTSLLSTDIGGTVAHLLERAGFAATHDMIDRPGTACPLKGDGSNRRFWRLTLADNRRAVVVAPGTPDEKGLREAGAVWNIGRHLLAAGVPVPELYAFAEDTGVLLCEDLGDTQLHSCAVSTDFEDAASIERLRVLYRQVLEVLAVMQCRGVKNFQADWCWDTPRYDRQLMLERESGYFLSACWQGLLGRQVPDGLVAEFAALADAASSAPACFFLHRDFQSRNIMIKDSRVRIIDFQGGRLGPLGYDLASLLLDPYSGLPQWFQEELYDYYMQILPREVEIDVQEFHSSYPALALQRNLQIVGAFAYLSGVCGKTFFRGYLLPALESLLGLARQSRQPALPVLAATAEQAQLQLQ